MVAVYRTAFPDIHFSADVVIAEGDKVAVYLQLGDIMLSGSKGGDGHKTIDIEKIR